MKVPFTRLGQRLAAASIGAVGLAVVAASTVALAGGTADASPRAATRPAVHAAQAAGPLSSQQLSYTAPLSGTTSTGRQVTGTFRPTVTRVRTACCRSAAGSGPHRPVSGTRRSSPGTTCGCR